MALVVQEIVRVSKSFTCIYMDVILLRLFSIQACFDFGENAKWPPGSIFSREEEATTIYLMDGKQRRALDSFFFFQMRGRARHDGRRYVPFGIDPLSIHPSIFLLRLTCGTTTRRRRPYCTTTAKSVLSKWCDDQQCYPDIIRKSRHGD